MPVTPITYRPLPYVRSGTLGELIGLRGQHEADAIRQRGDISAQLWANIGSQLSQAIQGYAQQKQQEPILKAEAETRDLQNRQRQQALDEQDQAKRQDTAFMALLEQQPNPDPKEVLAIYGPKRGFDIAVGLRAFHATPDPQDLDAKGKVLRARMMGMNALSPELRAQTYPAVRQKSIQDGLITAEDAPEAYDEAWWQQTVNYGKEPATPQALMNLGNGTVYDPNSKTDVRTGTAPLPDQEFVTRNGKVIPITKGTAQPGDLPYKEPSQAQPQYEWAVDPTTHQQVLATPAEIRAKGYQKSTTPPPDDSIKGLADLVARQPAILQSLTPTVSGQVMKSIGRDPGMLKTFETTRLEPIRGSATRLLTALDDLIAVDDKDNATLTSGAADLYGTGIGRVTSWRPGSAGANARAALAQVTGNLTLNMLAEAKAQSKTGATGFGQLSERELGMIESAATILKGEISEARALQELKRIRDATAKILKPGAGELDPQDQLLDELLRGGNAGSGR